MDCPGLHEERERRLKNLEKRLEAVEHTVNNCRRSTARLLLKHMTKPGPVLGPTNEGGNVEWHDDGIDSLL